MGKYHTIVADLKDRIVTGEFGPRLKLPTEHSIADRYCVSRSVVRRALDNLVAEGLATKKPGRGYFAIDSASESALPLVCIMNSWGGSIIQQYGWEKPLAEGLLAGGSMLGVRLYQDMSAAGVHGTLLPGNVDGLVIIMIGQASPEALLAKLPSSVPRVLVNRPSNNPQVPSVTVDNYIGAYRATRTMLEMGHSRIATDLTGNVSLPYKERLQGYIDAHREAGVEIDEELMLPISRQAVNSSELLRRCLDTPNRPSGLLLLSSTAQAWLYPLMRQLNLSIPNDISLVTFDEEDYSLPRSDVRVSSVVQPLYQMGLEAIRIIKSMLHSQEVEYPGLVLEPNLILRDSLRRKS